MLIWYIIQHLLLRPRERCKVLWWAPLLMCLSVCPTGYLRSHMCDLYQIFCTCCLWPWLGLPLAGDKIPRERGNFGGFPTQWQCIVTTFASNNVMLQQQKGPFRHCRGWWSAQHGEQKGPFSRCRVCCKWHRPGRGWWWECTAERSVIYNCVVQYLFTVPYLNCLFKQNISVISDHDYVSVDSTSSSLSCCSHNS